MPPSSHPVPDRSFRTAGGRVWTRPRSPDLLKRAEYWFTIFALLTLANALSPLFYDFFGSKSAEYTDVNPGRLANTLLVYAIAGGIAIRRIGATREVLARNPFLLMLFLLPLVSILWSADPSTTLRRAFAHLLTGCLCVYIVGSLSPEEFLRRLTLSFFIGGIASILYTIGSPYNAIHHGGGIGGSWKGVYAHKNELGRICSIALICAYFTAPLTIAQKRIRIATILLFVFLLIMSQSRTNWFIVAAMFGIVPLTNWLRNPRVAPGLRIFAFLLVSGGAVLVITLGADALLAAVGRDATFSGRATLWRGVQAIIDEKYPYLGAGYGAFFTRAGGIYQLTPYLSAWSGIPNHAHNGFLDTRANLGLPGVILLAAFIVVTGKRLITRVMADTDRRVWGAFTALLFLFLINNFSSSVSFKHSDMAWVILVVIYAYCQPPRTTAPRPSARRVQHPRIATRGAP